MRLEIRASRREMRGCDITNLMLSSARVVSDHCMSTITQSTFPGNHHTMHFGQYLLKKGAITPRQALEALDEQRRTMPFLGTIAVTEGVMTVEQVLAVLDELNRCGPSGTHFGQIAMVKGFIDEATRDRLLDLQRTEYEPLGEVLVKNGALTPKKMASLLKEFIHDAGIGRHELAKVTNTPT